MKTITLIKKFIEISETLVKEGYKLIVISDIKYSEVLPYLKNNFINEVEIINKTLACNRMVLNNDFNNDSILLLKDNSKFK